jgi:hypothetical protein
MKENPHALNLDKDLDTLFNNLRATMVLTG